MLACREVAKEDQIFLPYPPPMHQAEHNHAGKSMKDVYIDPTLSKFLKNHQIEGIFFMYDSFLKADKYRRGCILAY